MAQCSTHAPPHALVAQAGTCGRLCTGAFRLTYENPRCCLSGNTHILILTALNCPGLLGSDAPLDGVEEVHSTLPRVGPIASGQG